MGILQVSSSSQASHSTFVGIESGILGVNAQLIP